MGSNPTEPDDDVLLLAKDLAIALAIVVGIVAVIFAFTQVWPPVVVVESGSMTHPDAAFGRIGTIDPGDLIFVTKVDEPSDVATKGAVERRGGPRDYGAPGQVIIYQTTRSTPVIHRAMAWVEITRAEDGAPRYTVEAYGIEEARSITIPPLGLQDYRPNQEGFLTMGDSPKNPASDQALGIAPEPVAVGQILGKAQGEVPWFGLIKLMAAGNACEGDWVRVLRACAPGDLWVMFAVGMAVVLAIPLAVDEAVVYLEEREVVLTEGSSTEGEDGEDLSAGDPSEGPGEPP